MNVQQRLGEVSLRPDLDLKERGVCPDWVVPVDYDYEIGEPWKKDSMFVPLVLHMEMSKIVYA